MRARCIAVGNRAGVIPLRLLRHATIGLAAALALVPGSQSRASSPRLDGFNVIVSPRHPFGSTTAGQALAAAKRVGANTVAIVPFLWQAAPDAVQIVRGDDMPDAELRAAIRQARAFGFTVTVKPHVWVPERWAGAVEPRAEPDWQAWFAAYRESLLHIATIAAQERADVLAVGTELARTTQRPEWRELIASLRTVFSGTLTYVAHNIEEAEAVPFWPQLDVIGVTLYPSLGVDRDRSGRLNTMIAAAKRLDRLAAQAGKRIVVGEIGLRSATGATAKPWESAEERNATPDPLLQAEVIADWLGALRRPSVRGVLVWRWFTDPAAGGLADTDFTVQGKPAEGVLLCAWALDCQRH